MKIPKITFYLVGDILLILFVLSQITYLSAQDYPVYSDVPGKEMAYPNVTINFDRQFREWDGFGVNYVETSQTRDYSEWPQDYGGFSVLSESDRQQIIDLIFGEDGLKPGITKMFLDVWHEGISVENNDNQDPRTINPGGFDHTTTTQWMRYFNNEGLVKTRSWGGDIKILTTLYGPPPWMTRQGYINGRDLDPIKHEELAEYMVSWVQYLRREEHLPVMALSLHNEGDAYYRWPPDGDGPGEDEEDYNLYLPPEQVTNMMAITREMLDSQGLGSVKVTPGETQNWYRFHMWGYAPAIASNSEAVESLGLITSHSFAYYDEPASRFYGDWRSNGTDVLRLAKNADNKKTEALHAWVTSMSWGEMDAEFIDAIRRNIYMSKVNAVTPWAIIQRPTQWKGGDPNPRTAFHATEEGDFKILKGYYMYKQVTRAGQPGMAVAYVESLDPALNAIAFAANDTGNPDTFVLINIDDEPKGAKITLSYISNATFSAYRTTDDENYHALGKYVVSDGIMRYKAPAGSVTTFYMD